MWRYILICLFFQQLSFAQDNRTAKFKNLSAKEFDSRFISHQVWMNDGSFWAINEKGIFHHNGLYQDQIEIATEPDKSCLTKSVGGIFKFSENDIWLSYLDTGYISHFNPETRRFQHYEIPELTDSTGTIGVVVRIKRDPDGQLWLCTWGAGLIRFNQDGENQQYLLRHQKYEDIDGTKKRAGLFTKDVAFGANHQILVTFFNGGGDRLSYPLLFNSETETIQNLDYDQLLVSESELMKEYASIASRIIHWVYEETPGRYWLGSYSGLLLLDLNKGVLKRMYKDERDSSRLNQVNAMSYSRVGNELWVSTLNEGIMVVDLASEQINFIKSNPIDNQTVVSNRIGSISQDPFGNVWVVNGGNNISVFNQYYNTFKMLHWSNFDLEYSNRSQQNIPVNQIYVSDSDQLYISSATGLLKYDYNSKETDLLLNDESMGILKDESVRTHGITQFKIVDQNIFFLYTRLPCVISLKDLNSIRQVANHRGVQIIFLHEPNIRDWYYFRSMGGRRSSFNRLNAEFETDTLAVFESDFQYQGGFSFLTEKGQYLIADKKGRFALLNPNSYELKMFSPSQDETYFPDSTVISALVLGEDILLGTQKGLYMFNEETFAYEKLNKRLFLDEDEMVYAMIDDNEGNVWIALKDEIIRWNRATDDYTLYGKSDGLDVGSFLPSVGQKDLRGRLHFVTTNGVLNFYPENLKLKKSSFTSHLHHAKVNGNLVEADGDVLSLDWDQNNLEFTFYTNQVFELEPHSFEYKVDGLHKRWVSNGNSHTVRFDKLNYGKYTLHFRATNAYGNQSEAYSVEFEIDKPFWLKWWFLTAVALALILLVILLVRQRLKHLRKQSEKLQEMVQKRTAELEVQKTEAEKQKDKAEFQRRIVEEKQKEITDSITYAKRIQDAILPSDDLFHAQLENAFVLYLPKDIVAGDFYWIEILNDYELLLAAADCTGHGVPGAMVSVICNNALNRSVREFNLTEPGQILDKTRELVVSEFMDQNSTSEIKDGMDVALCKINKKDLSVLFAGAHNPLWIVRNGEILETKANKQPVGQFEEAKPFDTHTVSCQKGDTVYIFSDGYADQFGGEKGKKFKSVSLKKLILEIQDLSLPDQKLKLLETFNAWKGDYEQLDDVCIIGVRV